MTTKKSPVEKAIEALVAQVIKGEMPPPAAVIVHPQDAAEMKPDGPLMKAWREHAEQMKRGDRAMTLLSNQRVTYNGQRLSGVSWDEQRTMSKTELEQQLEASLWALCEGVEPMHYQMDVLRHIPHMRGSSERIRRFPEDGKTVLILCVCKVAMRFARCQYVSYTDQVQCAEEVLMQEAVAWTDIRCAFHRKEMSR